MSDAEKVEAQWAWLCYVNAPYVQTATLLVHSRLGLKTPPPAANDDSGGRSA